MKTLGAKEKQKRKVYYKYYLTSLCLKSIHANAYLSIQTRWEAFNSLVLFPLRSRRVQLKNRCLLSNRGKGILSKFKISRIQLRSCLAKGFFTGISNSSW